MVCQFSVFRDRDLHCENDMCANKLIKHSCAVNLEYSHSTTKVEI